VIFVGGLTCVKVKFHPIREGKSIPPRESYPKNADLVLS